MLPDAVCVSLLSAHHFSSSLHPLRASTFSHPTPAFLQNHISYIIVRLLIGFGLATFVCCQFWTSIMFAPQVVGMANAISGGWGNAGQQPRRQLKLS